MEDKLTGCDVAFSIVEDKDLPFMNAKGDMGEIMRNTIIDGDVDDDCQTDDEQKNDAKAMLKNELTMAINKFI